MENDCEVAAKNEVKHTLESSESITPADSTFKLSPNELSPDSTSEIKNPLQENEPLDPYTTGKLNGDCGMDCSGLSSSSASPNNNNSTACKVSSETNKPCNEKSYVDNVDEKCDIQKKEVSACKAEANVRLEEKDQIQNLSQSNQSKSEPLSLPSEASVLYSENSTRNKNMKVTNANEVTSTLEEKSTSEVDDAVFIKTDSKTVLSKGKKLSDTSSATTSKINEPFKPPTRYDLKSSSKVRENPVSESNLKQIDVTSKVLDKTGRNNKRKSEDKNFNASDGEASDTEKFPIQYKGFKKKAGGNEKNEKRLNLRWNPFNPSCKPNRKSTKCVPSRLPVGDEIDCSSLQQSEYAQYLGLQPILKFRCSNCGSSAFQSMVALNTHQLECTKSGKDKLDKSPASLSNPISEPKSTNIKLTRKVFLCSACGTYYEHWNLFLHMREVHRRYICLYCLGMFSVAEKLSEHLIQKHKITHQNFCNLEDFQKHSYQTFFMLCLTCDKVFSEMDDFCGHTCSNKKSFDGVEATNKSEATSNQECNSSQTNEACSSVSNKTGGKRTREANKKIVVSSKSSQAKKDESSSVTLTKKTDENGSSDPKEEISKPSEVSTNKTLEIVNNDAVESLQTENKASIQDESEVRSVVEQEGKLQESQTGGESLPSLDKAKPIKKSKSLLKKAPAKRKKGKDQEEESEVSSTKMKKISEEFPSEPINITTTDENLPVIPDAESSSEVKEELVNPQVPMPISQDSCIDVAKDCENKADVENATPELVKEEITEASKEEISCISTTSGESKNKLQTNLLKFKLPGMESDGESDDSQKLSLIVDENANSDAELKTSTKSGENSATDSDITEVQKVQPSKLTDSNSHAQPDVGAQDITLASEDVAVMALTLDDKIENIPIQTVLKECVRTSCMSCNYCRHAVKIAVNGKQLALHILSEHRYMPIKNDTPDDVINKLKMSLETLQAMFFNTETYDSSDPSIHVPYDQDSSFDCFQCNYVTSTHRDLFAHKRKSHTKSLLLCIMCKSNFYSYSELLCHLCPGTYNAEIQFHNVDINFRCCFCRLDTIPSAFRLMVHLRKTHHTCDICLENGIDQQKLSTHMWKHKLNHLCYRCGIAYASKPDITKHLFWKHGHESVLCKKCLQKKWPHVYHFCIPPTSFICEECNTSFSKAVALKVHKRMHCNDFPYSCLECNKKFVSKKLLQRHEERHLAIKNNVGQDHSETNTENEQKEEIINVTSVINESKESSSIAELSDSKEVEPKDKSHKKHKKDKDKKDKQVVDVYDLPPLNLSSESDSSDEDNNANENGTSTADNGEGNLVTEGTKIEQINPLENKESVENNTVAMPNEELTNNSSIEAVKIEDKVTSSNSPYHAADANTSVISGIKHLDKEEIHSKQTEVENGKPEDIFQKVKADEADIPKSAEDEDEPSENLENDSAVTNKEVEDIWKNFYSTNPQTSNLPYPLCAIKSEIALGIIMGDHDYCHQPVEPPTLREETTSISATSIHLINDQFEEVTETPQEKVSDVSATKDATNTYSPVTSPKKKPKSPKKKNSKAENENNSSSSSDSSSESSTSSCSCGPNCSCSSSSSNSSSSSSSDSESSVGDEGTKQEKKRKKRERHSKTKSDHEPELPKEQLQQPTEQTLPVEPVDPPVRESELETDETTTDEEFYDQQPQRIANQLLAEKRNQLMLLASAANVNNGNASPSPIVDALQPEAISTPKPKVKTKRKRKPTTKGKASAEKSVPNSHAFQPYVKDSNEPVVKPPPQYHSNTLPTTEPKLPSFTVQTPVLTETTGSGSETEKSRSSKRRRIPNKFYGYSSGEEEEKPAPSPKWKKQESVSTPQPRMPQVHPPTPRIQLTVPKQVIRKPYKLQKPAPKTQQPSSSDSTDSGSEMENQNQRTPHVPPAPTNQVTSTSSTSQKNEKDVYCYCRCPYDEVSEMIACDDENCEIEWFHFECVGILVPPRGQWFCPGCRKARGLPT
ncbi:misexpression suppressor of ras 4 [Rhodnius prolixus]